jgi:hypothetical protein
MLVLAVYTRNEACLAFRFNQYMVLAIPKGWVVVFLAVGLLQSCSSVPRSEQQALARNGVALLGVTSHPTVSSAMSEIAMSNMLQDIVQDTGRFSSLGAYKVSQLVGQKRYRKMLDTYGETGVVASEDVQILMAAQLPVSYAIITRIEENTTGPGASTVEALRNNAGELMNDRERVVHSTVRRVTLSATMINLRSGAAYWTKTYRAEPVTRSAYTRYFGSSFAGSLAATMANTVANGIRKPSGPAAPSIQLTLRSLMREVARNMRPG